MAVEAVVVFTVRIVVFLPSSRTNQVRIEAFPKRAHQADAIEVVGDPASVVDLSHHIPNSIPIYVFPAIVEEVTQSAQGHFQVRIIEFIAYIETQRTVFTSLLQQGMEEG